MSYRCKQVLDRFLLAGVSKPLSEMSMLAITKDNYKAGNYKIKTQRNDNMF